MDKKQTVWTISGFYVVVNKISVAAATMPPVLSTNKVLVYFLCNCFKYFKSLAIPHKFRINLSFLTKNLERF